MISSIIEKAKETAHTGQLASYIPALANQSKDLFAVYMIDEYGNTIKYGDYNYPFTLQSISKVLSFMVVAQFSGLPKVLEKVDVEPTGDPFNSIVRLEVAEKGKPFNPMINAGAITVASLLPGHTVDERVQSVIKCLEQITGGKHLMNEEVYRSELETANRNRAIAYYLKANDYLEGNVEEVLKVYLQLCSIESSVEDLARVGLFLAKNGEIANEKKRLISQKTAQFTKALMMTCGLYNASGKYAATVGFPMKTGVSGGVVCTIPNGQIEQLRGRIGIAVFSPLIDGVGNSVASMEFLQRLSEEYDLSVF